MRGSSKGGFAVGVLLVLLGLLAAVQIHLSGGRVLQPHDCPRGQFGLPTTAYTVDLVRAQMPFIVIFGEGRGRSHGTECRRVRRVTILISSV